MLKRAHIRILLAAFLMLLLLAGCTRDPNFNVEKTIVLPDSAGLSVFELLRAYHTVEFDSTASGTFVKSIDGTANTRSQYWLYFVDDTAGKVASDKFMLKGGEAVEWRYVSGY
jgi:uncharacterized protein YcfL